MNVKSNMSLAAARHLTSSSEHEEWYASSVHCSYYAAFQYMKYVLAYKAAAPMSYADQDSKSESSERGSHIFVWEEVKQLIKDKNFSEARKLDQRVKLLRNNRRMADYTTESFGLDEAVECADEAEGIIKKLKQFFP